MTADSNIPADYYETMATEHRLAALQALRAENDQLRAMLNAPQTFGAHATPSDSPIVGYGCFFPDGTLEPDLCSTNIKDCEFWRDADDAREKWTVKALYAAPQGAIQVAAGSHTARADEPKEGVGEPTALEADARRYRWLRNQPPTYADGAPRHYIWNDVAYTMYYDEVMERLGTELDAAIDAALALQQEPKP
jgi:hypothetical protein